MNADGEAMFSSPRYAQRSISSVPSEPYESLPESGLSWQIDSRALARCRELFTHGSLPPSDGSDTLLTFIDVPSGYDAFCRAHFAAVRRLRPDMRWEDACQIYAIALFAHALLCVELDDEREQLLERHWPQLRGSSELPWNRARPLISDGCRALARLDPITCSSMRRSEARRGV